MEEAMIKVFYDLETTGTDYKKHSIHQIAGMIEIDDEIVESFDIKTRPHPKALIEEDALKVARVTREQILAYPDMGEAHKKLVQILNKYIPRFNKKIKAWLVGFNNRSFDDQFFRAWFVQNGDPYFGSHFWSDSLDALVTASEYLLDRRSSMLNFQQETVAQTLGIEVDKEKLHDALYDVNLTRQIYRITTGREIEL